MVTGCPTCHGKGSIITDPCHDCHGKGRTAVHRTLRIKIPAGIHHGQAVRVAGEGEPPAPEVSPDGSGTRGDLHVVVRVKEENQFERDGNNLISVVPVAFTQLALGSTIDVETIDGTHQVVLPAGTQTNEIFSVAGAGLPDLRSGKRGDLVVIVKLVVPKKLSEEQRALLESYAETEHVPVNEPETSFWDKVKDAVTGGKKSQSEE